MKKFSRSQQITARAGTARGTSGIITFEEIDPEATIKLKTFRTSLGQLFKIETSHYDLQDLRPVYTFNVFIDQTE